MPIYCPLPLDKAVVVNVENQLYGDALAVLRRIDDDELIIEMPFLPPVGTEMVVTFYSHQSNGSMRADAVIASHVRHRDAERAVCMRAVCWR